MDQVTIASGGAHERARPAVIDVASCARGDLEQLGGKGARLAEMTQAGFPVPPAFCITLSAFGEFLRVSGVGAKVAAMGALDAAKCAEIREAVLRAEIPPRVAREIVAGYEALGRARVAVRSSAQAEDSASQSFAGQHDTLLDIAGDDALLHAVKVCWASLWSDRARTYRSSSEAGAIAVVVQKMVHADAAGVLFTIDPVGGHPDRMVLEACLGLGEGLVAGRVTTDSFLLDAQSGDLVERHVRYKVTMCAPVEAGKVGTVKVPPDRREAAAITDDQARELGRLALRLRAHYGCDQDVEWAVRDGHVHLLQTRPITTRPVRRDRSTPYEAPQSERVQRGTLWSRMDIGEIFTGVMSPLGTSFARYYQHHVHADCGRALGLLDKGDMSLAMGYLHGHVYLNVSYSAFLLGQSPPGRDQAQFTHRFTSEEVDLARYQNPFGQYPGGARLALSSAFWTKYAVTELGSMRRRAERMVASRYEVFDRFRALDLSRMRRAELHAEMERGLDYFHDMHVGYMPFYINAFGFYGVLTKLCAAWLGDDGANLQNRLKADMSNLRTVESAREVWKLAQRARASERVLAILQTTPLEEIPAALLADDEGARFWRGSFEPFLRANGTRGRQEMELTNPRWIDDPSYVFQMMRKYIQEGFSIDEVLQRRGRERAGSSEDVLARLPFAKRHALRAMIKLYGACSEMREATRMSMITSIWVVRSLVYEVGRRLVAEGVLRSLDEVAFLDFADVRAYLAGGAPLRDAFPRAKLDEARRAHHYYLRQPEPPLSFVGEHDPNARLAPLDAEASLRGLGTSPGRFHGKARVVHDLTRQADEFEPGEILVTTFTDASWTPLFAIAGAVVTDIGSMLSHSSIVAREFNIPSVVNTKTATRSIRTGDVLVVDGDRGLVSVVTK